MVKTGIELEFLLGEYKAGMEEMIKLRSKFTILLTVSILSLSAHASLVVSVTTDKSIYQLGETVEVYVSLYNPTSESLPLTYGSNLEATYLIDNSYYWHHSISHLPVILHGTIQSEQTLTWQLNHNDFHQTQYPLNIGFHSVQGASLAGEMSGQLSEVVTFQVIPEPTTLSLLALGASMIWSVRRK